MNLTPKQKRFCEEFVTDFNATQAAIRSGYSENTANRIGSENLSKLDIQNYISELQNKASEVLEISQNDLLKKLKTWVESDITLTLGLPPDELKELPLEIKQLISSYKHTSKTYLQGDTTVTEDYVEMKFVSKEKAIEMIAKHIGFFEKDNEQQSTNITMFELPSNGRD